MTKSSRKVLMAAPLLVPTSQLLSFTSMRISLLLFHASDWLLFSFLTRNTVTTCFIYFFFFFFFLFLYLKTSEQERMPGAICALAVRKLHTCFCGSAGAHDGEARGISKAGTSEPAGCVFPLDSRRPTCLCISAALKWLLPCRCARNLRGQVDSLFTSHAFTRLPG